MPKPQYFFTDVHIYSHEAVRPWIQSHHVFVPVYLPVLYDTKVKCRGSDIVTWYTELVLIYRPLNDGKWSWFRQSALNVGMSVVYHYIAILGRLFLCHVLFSSSVWLLITRVVDCLTRLVSEMYWVGCTTLLSTAHSVVLIATWSYAVASCFRTSHKLTMTIWSLAGTTKYTGVLWEIRSGACSMPRSQRLVLHANDTTAANSVGAIFHWWLIQGHCIALKSGERAILWHKTEF